MKVAKNNLLTLVFAVISFVAIIIPVAAPSVALATSFNSNVFNPTILAGPLVVCTGVPSMAGEWVFPACQNLCDLVAQIANVIYFMIAVVIWIVVPVLVAVGGIMIMIGGANPGMIEQGKKTITGAVIGLAIVLCAWLIVFTFVGAFGNLGKYVGGFGGANGQAACTVAPITPAPTSLPGDPIPLGGCVNNPPYTCGTGGGTFGSCPCPKTCKEINPTPGVINLNKTFGCQ